MTGRGKPPRRMTTRKRRTRDVDSITSPLKSRTHPTLSIHSVRPRKIPSIITISSSRHEVKGKGIDHDEHPLLRPEVCTGKESPNEKDVLNTVTGLKEDVNKLMHAVGFLANAWCSQNTISSHTATPEKPISVGTEYVITPKYSLRTAATEEILHKFLKTNPTNEKAKPTDVSGLVKKLFSPSEFQTIHPVPLGTKTATPSFKPNDMDPTKTATPSSKPNDNTPLCTPVPPIDPLYIPSWLLSLFGPAVTESLSYMEAAVACYIFKRCTAGSADSKETIIKPILNNVDGTRRIMQFLKPKKSVDQEIINLTACMLTYTERAFNKNQTTWFLPTYFSQYILGWTTHPRSMTIHQQRSFMGKIEVLTKVFVPMNDNNEHWYLIVFDFENQEVVLLDSFPQSDRLQYRITDAKLVALYMEVMLRDSTFYQLETTPRPRCSQFRVVIPQGLPAQRANSNDCGIWVASWMKDSRRCGYNLQVSYFSETLTIVL
ncbi:uncharacterized protein LOC130727815 [Lotus japonicus]|uniref:uncharacterized protein LOC130727815 n=3 Tax=Lotus japonicus TaxID=34305 RepID=UPI00258B7C58|nr:uncharacterized protein LOC130727815 [Lotus japonicus]